MAKKRTFEGYRRANEACARLILAAVGRYGGEDAALVRWARAVLLGCEARPAKPESAPGRAA